MGEKVTMMPARRRRSSRRAAAHALAPVISLEERLRERQVQECVDAIGGMYAQASSVAGRYSQLIMTDRKAAIAELPRFIEEVRNVGGGRAYESMAGGPNHDWVAPFFNIVGDVYPDLNWDQRRKIISYTMDYLNSLRYDYSQNHVELIHEPWLVGDILSNNWLYFCGYERDERILQSKRTWAEFSPEMDNTRSAFWTAFAVLRWRGGSPQYASPQVQEQFYTFYPQLTDRTLDATAAMIEVRARDPEVRDYIRKGMSQEEFREHKLQGYDPRFHDKIRKKILEEKWIVLT